MVHGAKPSDSVIIDVADRARPTRSIPGIGASLTFKVDSTSTNGAVLCTAAPIAQEKVGDSRTILQWLEENSRKLIAEHGRALREHGLWIITKTYATRRCAIGLLHSRSSEATIGLGVDIQGLSTLGPETSWLGSHLDTTTVVYDDNEGVVVFVCGVFVTKSLFRDKVQAADRREKQQFLRGGELTTPFTIRTADSDGCEILLEIEICDGSAPHTEFALMG